MTKPSTAKRPTAGVNQSANPPSNSVNPTQNIGITEDNPPSNSVNPTQNIGITEEKDALARAHKKVKLNINNNINLSSVKLISRKNPTYKFSETTFFAAQKPIPIESEKVRSEMDPHSKAQQLKEKAKELYPHRTLESKKKEPYNPPKEIQTLIDLWNTLGLRKHKDRTTKTYRAACNDIHKLIRGVFFNMTELKTYHNRKFSYEEISRAIQHFALAVTSMDHEPAPIYKMSLLKLGMSEFFYNPFFTEKKSQFLNYFENPPELSANRIVGEVEKNPMITNKLVNMYEKSLGIKPVFNQLQKNKFIRGANRLVEFYIKYRKQLSVDIPINEMADCLYEALIEEYKDCSLIEIGHLCSDRTFNKLLPAYLNRSAMWKSKE